MAKRFDIVEVPFGLCSDPNAQTAPEGSMSECSNFVKRRDGQLQPRNGAETVTLASLALTSITRIIPVDDDALLIGPEGAVWQSAPSVIVAELDDTDIAFFDESVRVISLNGNHYINTTKGIRRFQATGDAYVYPVGSRMHMYFDTETSTDASGWLADDYIIACRAVIKRIDSHGNIVRSAPSYPRILANELGSAAYIEFFGYIFNTDLYPSTYDEELWLEIYRTKQTGIANSPGDVMYFYAEAKFVWNSTYWYAYIERVDKNDDELGAYLYTSASQQGLELSNQIPPMAHEMSYYNGSLFLGNCTPYPRSTFAMLNSSNDLAGAEGAGTRTLTGDFSTGNDTITNVSDTTGIEVGQYLDDLVGNIDSDTYVESKTSSTIVMSKVATGTGSTQTFYVYDTITFKVDSSYVTVAPAAGTFTHCPAGLLYETREEDLVVNVIDFVAEDYSHDLKWSNIYVEPLSPDDSAILIWATNGDCYQPELNGPTLDGGVITYDDDDGHTDVARSEAHYVYTSKAYQPEYFTLANQRSVGNKSSIDRLIPLRDANLIFKRDGLFSMIGYNADSGWSTQTLNTSVKILRPDAAVVVDDKVYAIAVTGFVIIDATGTVTDLSRYYFHNEIQDALDALLIDSTTETLGCWVVYDSKFQEVIFALPSVGNAYVSTLYVYNIITRSFTTWTGYRIYHMARASDTSDTSLFIAGLYHDQPSDYFWKFIEAEYGRDNLYPDLDPFYLGDVEGTPMALFIDNGEDITTDNVIEYGGTNYTISASSVSTDSGLCYPTFNTGIYDLYLVCADDTYIYGITGSGGIYYVRTFYRNGPNLGSIHWVGPISATPLAICADASYVYWVDSDGDVYRWDKSGSEENLFTISAGTAYGLAVNDTNLYWTTYASDKICYRPKDGSGAEADLITSLDKPWGLCIYGTDIYWTEVGGIPGLVKVRAIAGGGTTTLYSDTYMPYGVAVDGTSVYYILDTGDDTDIRSVPVGGGSETTHDTIEDSYIRALAVESGASNLFCVDTTGDRCVLANYEDDLIKLTLNSSSGIDGLLRPVDIYDALACVVTWLPKYGETRALRKHFLAGSFIFPDIDDLSSYQRRLSDAVSYTTGTIRDQTNRYIVPIAHARKIELEPSIKIESVENANWKLSGMSLEYTIQAPRGVKI